MYNNNDKKQTNEHQGPLSPVQVQDL